MQMPFWARSPEMSDFEIDRRDGTERGHVIRVRRGEHVRDGGHGVSVLPFENALSVRKQWKRTLHI